MISRRKFLTALTGCGVAASIPIVGVAEVVTEEIERSFIEFKHSRISTAFNKYRIAFISDLHAGIFLSDSLLNRTVALLNNSDLDLLLLGGDYISIPDSFPAALYSSGRNPPLRGKRTSDLVKKIFQHLGQALAEVKVRDGTFAVMGNHDHWNDGKLCIETLNKYGVKFLINSEQKIQRGSDALRIFGVDDYWTGIPNMAQDFIAAEKSDLRILLNHNPDFVGQSIDFFGNCFDLALSGHTHGGQIRFDILGPVSGYNIRYSRFGMGSVKIGESLSYTSRGIGVVDLPYRINCRPEVTVFELLAI